MMADDDTPVPEHAPQQHIDDYTCTCSACARETDRRVKRGIRRDRRSPFPRTVPAPPDEPAA